LLLSSVGLSSSSSSLPLFFAFSRLYTERAQWIIHIVIPFCFLHNDSKELSPLPPGYQYVHPTEASARIITLFHQTLVTSLLDLTDPLPLSALAVKTSGKRTSPRAVQARLRKPRAATMWWEMVSRRHPSEQTAVICPPAKRIDDATPNRTPRHRFQQPGVEGPRPFVRVQHFGNGV
jgi:hypothetical protein